MPWDEALMRAGSLEALLPHLREARILARHNGVYHWPGGGAVSGPGEIKPDWWANVRVDPAAGRMIFTRPGIRLFWLGGPPDDRPPVTRDVFAVGIEVERAAVERLFSVVPRPPGRQRGMKRSPVWEQIFRHFDPIVAREGKFRSVGSAATAVEAWLEKNNKSLSRSAIERGIPKYRPDWIAA